MKRYIMNSGGKDSMASCIIDFEQNGYGGSVDGVVMGELMFSHKYNIPDKSVDMILCDLPYGTTACKWDNVIPFEPLWEQYKRIIKDNGAIVLFGGEPFSSKLRL